MSGALSTDQLREKAHRLLVDTQRAELLSDGRFRLPEGFIARITDRVASIGPLGEPSLVIAYTAD